MTWKPKNQKEREWLRGVNDALGLVAEWDRYVAHGYRLSDCIKAKLNLVTKKKIRKIDTTKDLIRYLYLKQQGVIE